MRHRFITIRQKPKYYANLLDRLDIEAKKKMSYQAKKKILFYYDYALAHSSTNATAGLAELRCEVLLIHNIRQIWRCNVFLFPNIKALIKGFPNRKI